MSPRSRMADPAGPPERRDVYERLADELRQDILSGRYQPGDRLPSTQDIMTRTGVANLTVRGAYRVLMEEGLVEPVPKRGFHPRRPTALPWRRRPDPPGGGAGPPTHDRWAADAEAAGLRPEQEITIAIGDASVLVAGRPAAERLGLPAGARVLVRRAVRRIHPLEDGGTSGLGISLADSLADDYYPYDLVRDTALAAPAPVSAAAVLASIGRAPQGYRDELRPRLASAAERRVLALPQVSVVLEQARLVRTADGQPVLLAHRVRRGDGATFAYEFSDRGR